MDLQERRQADARFSEYFHELIPEIQKEWPSIAKDQLVATLGSFDEVVRVITAQTMRTREVVQEQLLELTAVAEAQARHVGEQLEPLEDQLERLLDELDSALRPRLEEPVRKRPLLAIGIAAGIGLLMGLVLATGRRDS